MEAGFTINGNVAVLHRQVTELTDDEIYDLKQVVYQIGLVVMNGYCSKLNKSMQKAVKFMVARVFGPNYVPEVRVAHVSGFAA